MADTSYSVYLFHMFFISMFGRLLFGRNDLHAYNGAFRVAFLLITVIPTAYLVSWLLNVILEKPGIESGRFVVNAWLPAKSRRLIAVSECPPIPVAASK
jgi:peptidoglycan/LPS O-acetylase OafA/YrhL